MTLSIEERAKQLASLITHDHEIYGPRAVGAILDALRAVEVAALERAAKVAATDFKDEPPATEWERGYDCGRQYAVEEIRALMEPVNGT